MSDCIEIIFFASLCYYFTLWLSKDRQKNLVGYFYGYCILATGAYYGGLSTVALFLFTGFPVALVLFIILHQEILQRNFIALHTISAKTTLANPKQWHEILVRSCLVLLHKHQSIICVIEQKQSLENFIETLFVFNTPLQHGLLEMLVQSSKKDSFVWLNHKGTLKSIESTWISHEALVTEHSSIPQWQQNALLFTTKTDALVFSSELKHGTFSFIAQGKLLENLTADQVARILSKCLTNAERLKNRDFNANDLPHSSSGSKNMGDSGQSNTFDYKTRS